MWVACVRDSLDVVDSILHGVLRREILVLHHRILLEVLQMAAVMWHPEMPHRVFMFVVLLHLKLATFFQPTIP